MMTLLKCNCCSVSEVHALLITFSFSAYTSGVASEYVPLAELQNTQCSKQAVSFFCGNCPRLGSVMDCTQMLGIDSLNIKQPFPIYIFPREADIESLH